VLEDVDLDIWPLDSAFIVGPNGAGKTTLLKLVLGLLTPDKGSIRIYGQEPAYARRRIGYVPQYAHYDACFPISAIEVVCMGRIGNALTGRYTKQEGAAEAALAAVTWLIWLNVPLPHSLAANARGC
jgi:zinc transport system ATP-binding protein